jgi:hypothetical protein
MYAVKKGKIGEEKQFVHRADGTVYEFEDQREAEIFAFDTAQAGYETEIVELTKEEE